MELGSYLTNSNSDSRPSLLSISTGGASGLGAESAIACARAGASAIVLTDLATQKEKADGVAKSIAEVVGDKTKVVFFEHDVTKEPAWETVMEQ